MKTIAVPISSIHIETGEAGNCLMCPLALAVSEMLLNTPFKNCVVRIYKTIFNVYTSFGGEYVASGTLGWDAQDFVNRVDRKFAGPHRPKPCTVHLNVTIDPEGVFANFPEAIHT